MDEMKRVEEKIGEKAGGGEEGRVCLELFQAALQGQREGSSGGAVAGVRERVDHILEEIEEIAARIGSMI